MDVMKKKKKSGVIFGLFTFVFLTAVTLLHTTVQAAGTYTFDQNTGTVTILTNDGFADFKDSPEGNDINKANVKKAIVNPGVTVIADTAFMLKTSIQTVELPEGITSIGVSAFLGCSSLSSINLPNSLTSIGEYAFTSCEKLKSVSLPPNLTSIGGSTFSSCFELSS